MLSKFFTLLSLFLSTTSALWCGQKCFKMSDVQVMTFYKDQFITAPDGRTFGQIFCADGNACHLVDRIETVQCKNQGVDQQGKVNWKCVTNLVGDDIIVGYTNPTCYGYRNVNDNEYAHTGSCLVMVKVDIKPQKLYTPPVYTSPQSKYVHKPHVHTSFQTVTNTPTVYNELYTLCSALFFLFCLVLTFMCCCPSEGTQTNLSSVNRSFKHSSGSNTCTNSNVTVINASNNSINSSPVSPLVSTLSSTGLRQRVVPPVVQHNVETVGVSSNSNHPFNASSVPAIQNITQQTIQQQNTQQDQKTVTTVGKSDNSKHPFAC